MTPERRIALAQWYREHARDKHPDLTDEAYYRLRKRAAREHGIWREDVP